jgi:hypothetical protein
MSGALGAYVFQFGSLILISTTQASPSPRLSAREKEISIRLAMGAGRSRLTGVSDRELASRGPGRHAWSARRALGCRIPCFPDDGNGLHSERFIDARVLLFTAGVSARSGILLGLAAALRSTRVDLGAQVKGAARPRLSFGFANGLVVFQSSVLRQHYV